MFNEPQNPESKKADISGINEFKDDSGNTKTLNYCPYCGDKLVNKNNTLYCEKCDEEIGFVATGEEINNDDFEGMLIERKGKRYGTYMLILASIFTIFSFLFITLTMMSTQSTGEGVTNYAFIIGTTLIGYVGVIGDVVVLIVSTLFGLKVKRLGYKRVGTSQAAFWVSMIGFAYGLLFIILLVAKSI